MESKAEELNVTSFRRVFKINSNLTSGYFEGVAEINNKRPKPRGLEELCYQEHNIRFSPFFRSCGKGGQ